MSRIAMNLLAALILLSFGACTKDAEPSAPEETSAEEVVPKKPERRPPEHPARSHPASRFRLAPGPDVGVAAPLVEKILEVLVGEVVEMAPEARQFLADVASVVRVVLVAVVTDGAVGPAQQDGL